MDWTPEYRLRLIAAIVTMAEGVISYLDAERIIYLCNRPSNWLENNISNFNDAIEFVRYKDEQHRNP